jgi:hypothetical protein
MLVSCLAYSSTLKMVATRRLTLNGLHGVKSLKRELFITTTVRTHILQLGMLITRASRPSDYTTGWHQVEWHVHRRRVKWVISQLSDGWVTIAMDCRAPSAEDLFLQVQGTAGGLLQHWQKHAAVSNSVRYSHFPCNVQDPVWFRFLCHCSGSVHLSRTSYPKSELAKLSPNQNNNKSWRHLQKYNLIILLPCKKIN